MAGSQIENRLSGQKFSVLLVPECEVLPVEAARLFRDYANAGGTVVMTGCRPRMALVSSDDGKLQEIIREMDASGRVLFLDGKDRSKVYELLDKYIPHPVRITDGKKGTVNNHPSYPSYLIDPYMHGGEDIDGVMFTRYLKDGMRNTLFMNYGSKPEVIEVEIESDGEPEIWNTFTGEITSAEVLEKQEGKYRIRLELPCNYGIFVVSGL